MSQDFQSLRQKYSGKLYRDPDFKPSSKIYGHLKSNDYEDIEWLRPKEICENPKFQVQGFSRSDIFQGEIGNCWFLAALAALAENETLFRQVVPEDNNFDDDYAGIFHFR
jgi:calpain, invertebrate